MSKSSKVELPQWGRVLVTGGIDWPTLGRKATKNGPPLSVNPDHPDLPAPHILRSVSNVRMKRIFSSHSSCHAVLLSVDGDVYIIGRNEHGQCGLPIRPVPGSSKPSGVAVWDAYMLDAATDFSPALPSGPKGHIVAAACGRSHTLLITAGGSVYSAGLNTSGQCGHPESQTVPLFTRIETGAFIKERDPVVAASCGLTFSMLLTQSGKLYTMGSSEKGQLGNGRTGEHFTSNNRLAFNTFSEPFLVKQLADKNITSIACGQQHSIALDDQGYVYVWGFGGYGRLGLGSQQDQLTPTLVPQFARENVLMRAKSIYAGPTNSAVVDGQSMFWIAGKWKTSGDGSAGQGFMTFKYLPDMMGVKVTNSGLGGVTLLCTAIEEASLQGEHGATMNICWGQNANCGELGLGEGKPRSATKPLRCETLDGIAILDIAAAQNTTFYLARNMGERYGELPRWPEVVPSQEVCMVCGREEGEGGEDNALLECEKCENPWHLHCLSPKLSEIPEGEWHCPNCQPPTAASKSNSNGKRANADSDDEEDAAPTNAKKRRS
ncbi:RCC1/BLIP-II [Moesziomyces antarcticus]|uniref:Related to SRM1 \|nr:RCC1/BLIP-II [Moesziomyces antarcticus]GAK66247.1 RCC1/BLIP-II [Moesziomyces antarcticus]SPO48560.1 related to SRM1 \